MLTKASGDLPLDEFSSEFPDPLNYNQKLIKNYLFIRTKTWLINTCGLFDYTSKNLKISELNCDFICTEKYYLCRKDCEVSLLTSYDALTRSKTDTDLQLLLLLEYRDGNFYIHPVNANKSDETRTWLVLRYLNNKSISFNVGDCLRLGRYTLLVKDVVGDSVSPKSASSLYNFKYEDCYGDSTSPIALDKNVESNINLMCRICFGEMTTKVNIRNCFIAPCRCKGSIQWVHIHCIRAWLAVKMAPKKLCNTVYWQPAKCELCKTTYKPIVYAPCVIPNENDVAKRTDSIQIQYKKFRLLESFRLKPPYVILKPENQAGFYSISLNGDSPAHFGRSEKSDLKLTDISVSRVHATLSYKNPKFASCLPFSRKKSADNSGFILKDKHSKFGTLVELCRPVQLKKTFPFLVLQIGRTLVYILLK